MISMMNFNNTSFFNTRNITRLIAAVLACSTLCSCFSKNNTQQPPAETAAVVDTTVPVIEFTPVTHSQSGEPEYYLFDDNPEHLNPAFLADGATPSSIAHFEDLTPGIYTVFSYHHRGDSADYQADLYYDTAFSSDNGGVFEILNLGLDNTWNWNQAWADYSETTVLMPEFLRTINCTCVSPCACMTENGDCPNKDCPAYVRNEQRIPKTNLFSNLNTPTSASSEPVLLSELVSYIGDSGLNKFRYGGYNEPMWLMMRFRVVSGTVTFDTMAYQNKNNALDNFDTLLKGPYDYEPQYKGIAQNAPIVETEFTINIDNDTKSGPVPVTVKNARVPDGYTIQDGTFATNVSTWREYAPIAAESDLMILEYKDDTKLALYGEDAENPDNIWRFDPFHNKLYSRELAALNLSKLEQYGVETGGSFEPNGKISELEHPEGTEISSDEFYSLIALNLGNFGVTNIYKIHISNSGDSDREFSFDMKSIAGQVYRYKQTSSDGDIITDDGGYYYMKKFDDDPAEDPASTTEPKERVKAAEYSDTLTFDIAADSECTVEIAVTTLTGCTAPMHNTMSIN